MSIYGYRRGSIFWALTLIGVGCIFLWQNFNPAVRPWQIIAKFWPILIIFWGLSKLIEYLQVRAHPDRVAPPLFSGSEVVLLVLILIMGTIVSKIVLRFHDIPHVMGINGGEGDIADLFTNSYTYSQNLSQAATPQPRLLILNHHGDVELRASDLAHLEAVVKETIRAESEDEAKKISSQLKISFAEEAGRYVLQTNLDSLPNSGHGVRLDLSLRVPKATSAEVTAERGDIVFDGLHGDQTITARRGDVHVAKVEGLLRVEKSGGLTEIHDVKGNVELDGRGRDVEITGVTGTVAVNGDFVGSMQFRNVTQTLRFISSRTDMTVQKLTGHLNLEGGSLDASGVEGPFEISTRQKDITLEDFRHAVRIADTNGDIRLRATLPPLHGIDVDLKKGEIDLTLPDTSNFQIEARSTHGDVDCDFSGPNLRALKEGGVPSITGFYGKGGPTIHLTTASGTIRLARAGGRPAAPSPSAEGGEKTTQLYRRSSPFKPRHAREVAPRKEGKII